MEDDEDEEVTDKSAGDNFLPPEEKQGLLYLVLTTVYMMDGIVEEGKTEKLEELKPYVSIYTMKK